MDEIFQNVDGERERNRDFIKDLYAQRFLHKQQRTRLVRDKLKFITTLAGASFITFTQPNLSFDLSKLILVIPFVCIAYDLFIFGEHYRVRRIEVFLLKNQDACTKDENKWQSFVRKRRDILSNTSTVLSSAVITIGVVLLTIINLSNDPYYNGFLIILVCLLLAIFGTYILFNKASSKLDI